MHRIDIPAWATERVVARHGTAHPYAELDPRRTALIVIDLQNGYMLDGVAHALCPLANEIVPNVNRLAAAVRRNGGKVFWVQNTHDASWHSLYGTMLPDRVQKRIESVSAGTYGHELHAGLEVRPDDVLMQKWRYSAFLPDSSDLAVRLRASGYDTVLITGTLTNVCCESSARDAMMMNFRTVMVEDANAAVTDFEHNASLVNFYVTFGDVMSTDMLLACLERETRTRDAA